MFKGLNLVNDGDRILLYRPLKKVRKSGVCATLVGYITKDQIVWY